jgi:hypothetical protein
VYKALQDSLDRKVFKVSKGLQVLKVYREQLVHKAFKVLLDS